jgi:hypothetical protein
LKLAKVLLSFFIFTVLLSVLPLLLKKYANSSYLIPGFWTLFFFICALTLIVVTFILMVQKRNNAMYAQAFLGGTTFKLLACLVFVLVFVRHNRPDKITFIVDFMYLYLFNTVFEIYGLLRNLRNQKSK